jgi:hypothetical protein
VTSASASTGQGGLQSAAARRAFTVTPFQRLARTHFTSALADAMVAVTLADSLFFSLPADSARAPVVRYLLITMLPFAVIAPLIGPLIDRLKGGHRFVLVGSAAARAVLCWLMIAEIAAGGASFFLLALCVLVAQRAYHVARSAIVPTVVVDDDELIEANSKLAMISGLAGFIGVVPAAILQRLAGPGWALGLAIVTYGVAVLLGLRIPASRVAVAKADEVERHELRGAGIVLAGSAMGLLRMCVGFLTLLIAFDFRGGDRRPWEFAVVAGVSVASGLVGAAVAPRLKALTSEENMLTGALGLVVVGTFFSLFIGEVLGAAIVGSCVGFGAAIGKLAFDSILQRDAPDANRGRSFARFETRFQVSYVIGSFIPVAVQTGARAGFAVLLAVALFATASYVIGRMAWAHRSGERQTAATAAAVEIEERFAVVSVEVKGRLAAAPRRMVGRLRGGRVDDGGPDDPTVVAGPGAPGAPGPGAVPVPGDDAPTVHLAGASPVAWDPDAPTVAAPGAPPESAYPWEPPPEPPAPDYLADLDPAVTEPFPWAPAPDDPSDPSVPPDPTRPEA